MKIIYEITPENMPKSIVHAETVRVPHPTMRSGAPHRVYLASNGKWYSARALSLYLGYAGSTLVQRERRTPITDKRFLAAFDEAKLAQYDKMAATQAAKKKVPDKNRKSAPRKLAAMRLTPFEKSLPLPDPATGPYENSWADKPDKANQDEIGDYEAVKLLKRFNAKMRRKGFLPAKQHFTQINFRTVKTIDEVL